MISKNNHKGKQNKKEDKSLSLEQVYEKDEKTGKKKIVEGLRFGIKSDGRK